MIRTPRVSSILLLLLVPHLLQAFPSHTWGHLQGRHFTVSFNEASQSYAERVLAIAEETRTLLTGYLGAGAYLRRISIVISDDADQPNGEALVADPIIQIDCRKGPSLLRGETDWLRTVVTHELSHQYSFHVLKAPFSFGLGVGTQSVVSSLNADLGYTLSPLEYPQWLLEGLAQMGSRKAGADSHDAIRQMVLRDAWLTGRLLTIEEMGRFEGTSTDYELAYNQGFALLIDLETRYPGVPLAKLCRLVAKHGLEAAVLSLYHKTLEQIDGDWKQSLEDQFAEFKDKPRGPKEFPDQGPLTMETDQTPSGRALVANWGNDYTRFQLFVKDPSGRYQARARDTGTQVVEDTSTGTFWFTGNSYDFLTGTSTSEVFQLLPSGRQNQVTFRERVLAFDVWEGRLIRTRYQGGVTEVVLRELDGTDRVLGTLPSSMGIYALSVVSPVSVVLSVGTGDGVHAAVLSGGQVRLLWPTTEVIDVVRVAQDRLVLSSTRDGTPQLYWVDLAEDPRTWYQLTALPGGARFPRSGPTPQSLTYSEFQFGGWHRGALDPMFLQDHPIPIPGPAVGDLLPTEDSPTTPVSEGTTATDIVVHADLPWLGAVAYDATSSRGTSTTLWTVQGGLGLSVYDAPGDWEASANILLSNPLNSPVPTETTYQWAATGAFNLGPLRASLNFQTGTESVYRRSYDPMFDDYHFYHLGGQIAAQVSRNQTLSLVARNSWEEYTSVTPSITYFSRKAVGLRWTLSDSPSTSFDPAHLGQSGYGARLGFDAVVPKIEDARFFDPAVTLGTTPVVLKPSGTLAGAVLLFGSRLSVGASIDGFYDFRAVEGNLAAPGVLSSLGGSSWFAGYPAGYTGVSDMVSGVLQVRTNPLVDKASRPRFWDRLNLGAKLEAGAGHYFSTTGDRGLKFAVPLSAEVSLESGFYQAPDHQSDLSLRFAMALDDFVADNGGPSLARPFQVYAGYRY